MATYFEFLKKVYFFENLSDTAIKKVLNVCHKTLIEAGHVIFVEGEKADRFYIVIGGAVEVWKDYNKPDAEMLAVHGPGHLFGEMALIDDKPRSATIVAGTDTNLLFINRKDFQKVIRENFSVATSIMKSVSSMVRKSNESYVENLREQNVELERAYKELKATQEELLRAERLSALGKFSSLILHDIKNPLSILRGYAEILSIYPADSEKAKKYSKKIINEADRINSLASELLDFSRGDIRLSVGIVDIEEFINTFIEDISPKFKAKKINLTLNLEYKGKILMDEDRMMRVFMNLANNSAKAMPDGGEFTFHISRKESYLYFEVVDTGEGMSQDVLKKIFEPFFSFSKSGGTGLGMSIVKSIIDAHNGVLSVQSKEFEGTTFTIAIPVQD
ncbi:MAG: cyclic nucleotide-binding domain-containing protein [Candidatus Pacearchaeota archaeon]|nr:cyclic nucleotide-binding domain-containing protein [Candidatus Pacearchaeota archaeon]